MDSIKLVDENTIFTDTDEVTIRDQTSKEMESNFSMTALQEYLLDATEISTDADKFDVKGEIKALIAKEGHLQSLDALKTFETGDITFVHDLFKKKIEETKKRWKNQKNWDFKGFNLKKAFKTRQELVTKKDFLLKEVDQIRTYEDEYVAKEGEYLTWFRGTVGFKKNKNGKLVKSFDTISDQFNLTSNFFDDARDQKGKTRILNARLLCEISPYEVNCQYLDKFPTYIPVVYDGTFLFENKEETNKIFKDHGFEKIGYDTQENNKETQPYYGGERSTVGEDCKKRYGESCYSIWHDKEHDIWMRIHTRDESGRTENFMLGIKKGETEHFKKFFDVLTTKKSYGHRRYFRGDIGWIRRIKDER